jgi:hypothetical protein
LLVLANTKSKAQNPQPPVKKETVMPTKGTPVPKTEAADIFAKLGDIKGEAKSATPVVSKGANPAFLKGANPAVIKTNPTLKPAQSATNNQVAPRHTPPPANNQVAPRHTPPPANNQVAPRHTGPKH